jgi:hypothetical protein
MTSHESLYHEILECRSRWCAPKLFLKRASVVIPSLRKLVNNFRRVRLKQREDTELVKAPTCAHEGALLKLWTGPKDHRPRSCLRSAKFNKRSRQSWETSY